MKESQLHSGGFAKPWHCTTLWVDFLSISHRMKHIVSFERNESGAE